MPIAGTRGSRQAVRMIRIERGGPARRGRAAGVLGDRAGRDAGRPVRTRCCAPGRRSATPCWSRAPTTGARYWLALDGDRVVGGAELGGSVEDNRHVADLEVCVRPDARRRGVGRALHDEAVRRARDDGRSTVCGEVYVAAARGRRGQPGVRLRHRARLRQRPPRGSPGAAAAAGPGEAVERCAARSPTTQPATTW